jgi:hypothetical protein
VLSPFDLSCGWNGVKHHDCRHVSHQDANRLGINMLAYVLAYHDLGKFLSTTTVYYENEQTARGAFVFGQLRHGGDWDTDPSAAGNLLKAVSALTSGRVKFQRRALDPEAGLADVPFLYMTGHHDFRLSERAVLNLRAFLARGGFLLADACCGRAAFDAAFRREIARVVPGGLKPISPEHPVLSCHFRIAEVGYTPLVSREQPGSRDTGARGDRPGRAAPRALQPVRPRERLGARRPPVHARRGREGRVPDRDQRHHLRDDPLTVRPARMPDRLDRSFTKGPSCPRD